MPSTPKRGAKGKEPPQATPSKPPADAPKPTGGEEEDEEEQRMDVAFIQGFADKIQRLPDELGSRPKISIPKRGEKDFEPLAETVNLQEMMLQSSRQALFDALQGVRGMSTKALSHALITPSSPYPTLMVSRGHVLDSLGLSVRRDIPFSDKKVTRIHLLPEEAMYLTERGSLQIWNGRDPQSPTEAEEGVGQWCDEEFGIKGAIEMSVMEVFGRFMGSEGLTWQRYQAYAYLKRLGYTVQRTRQFIPEYFLAGPTEPVAGAGVIDTLRAIPGRLLALLKRLVTGAVSATRSVFSVGLGFPIAMSRSLGPFLSRWSGRTYSSLFAELRFIPAGHTHPVPPTPTHSQTSIYDPLTANPYLPFFHVWKPVTNWSKAKWDKGSETGIQNQRPDYILAVVESRDTPMPTLSQLDQVFTLLPDEPKGPTRRVGPQYERKRPERKEAPKESWWSGLYAKMFGKEQQLGNPANALRNGDRALIVAVNDSGNTGWVRFGRTGFADFPMV